MTLNALFYQDFTTTSSLPQSVWRIASTVLLKSVNSPIESGSGFVITLQFQGNCRDRAYLGYWVDRGKETACFFKELLKALTNSG